MRRTLQVVSHVDLAGGVENIRHDNEVNAFSFSGLNELDFVKTIKAGDHRVWKLKQVKIVVLHDEPEMLEFIVRNSFEHKLAVRRVIKQ
jgi:hypothetical protein